MLPARPITLLLGPVLAVALLASCGAARPAPVTGFTDEFAAVDPTRWAPAVPHVLGRSRIDPANATVAGGALALTLPGGTTDGAEVRSVATMSTGTVRARMRVADAPGSVTGFFLYAPPDLAHEVDMEIHNSRAGRLLLTTYDRGRQTHSVEVPLGFDPTAADHDYAFTLSSAGVVFSVDGVVRQSWRRGVPSAPMNLYANAWYPRWLPGGPAPTTRSTRIESITVGAASPTS